MQTTLQIMPEVEIIIDEEDVERVAARSWHKRNETIFTKIKGQRLPLARFIAGATVNDGQRIYHKDRNTLNNSKSNFINECPANANRLDDSKRCMKCNGVFSLDDFPYNAKSKDKRSSWCKTCHSNYLWDWLPEEERQRRTYKHTDEYKQKELEKQRAKQEANEEAEKKRREALAEKKRFAPIRKYLMTKWQGMVRRCGKDPHYKAVEIRMTKQEYLDWAIPALAEFRKTYSNETCSIDRIESKGHYELDNIRFIPYGENSARASLALGALKVNKESPRKDRLQAIAKLTYWSCMNLGIDLPEALAFMETAVKRIQARQPS